MNELEKQKERALRYNEYLKAKHGTKSKITKLKYLYGISEDEYIILFAKQNGECAICQTPQSKLKRKLAVDHCHLTDNVRGLLCEKCNLGLGLFGENEFRMARAIDYIRRNYEEI